MVTITLKKVATTAIALLNEGYVEDFEIMLDSKYLLVETDRRLDLHPAYSEIFNLVERWNVTHFLIPLFQHLQSLDEVTYIKPDQFGEFFKIKAKPFVDQLQTQLPAEVKQLLARVWSQYLNIYVEGDPKAYAQHFSVQMRNAVAYIALHLKTLAEQPQWNNNTGSRQDFFKHFVEQLQRDNEATNNKITAAIERIDSEVGIVRENKITKLLELRQALTASQWGKRGFPEEWFGDKSLTGASLQTWIKEIVNKIDEAGLTAGSAPEIIVPPINREDAVLLAKVLARNGDPRIKWQHVRASESQPDTALEVAQEKTNLNIAEIKRIFLDAIVKVESRRTLFKFDQDVQLIPRAKLTDMLKRELTKYTEAWKTAPTTNAESLRRRTKRQEDVNAILDMCDRYTFDKNDSEENLLNRLVDHLNKLEFNITTKVFFGRKASRLIRAIDSALREVGYSLDITKEVVPVAGNSSVFDSSEQGDKEEVIFKFVVKKVGLPKEILPPQETLAVRTMPWLKDLPKSELAVAPAAAQPTCVVS